jgi:plastocyanin domain-containing protein
MNYTSKLIVRALPFVAFALLMTAALPLAASAQQAEPAHDHSRHASSMEGAKEKPEKMECKAEHTDGEVSMTHINHDAMKAKADEAAQPQIEGGVQIVEISVGKMGYTPGNVELKANQPVRLLFTRTEDGGCTGTVKIPEYGVDATELPLNEQVAIEFTPTEAGSFTWTCSMDMLTGTLLVRS